MRRRNLIVVARGPVEANMKHPTGGRVGLPVGQDHFDICDPTHIYPSDLGFTRLEVPEMPHVLESEIGVVGTVKQHNVADSANTHSCAFSA